MAEAHSFGRYEILEPIGEGRSFRVYRARVSGVLGFVRDVTLKVPRSQDAAAMDRLVASARRAVSLSHATLLQLVDVGRAGTEVYLVSELARGASLSSHLERVAAGSSSVAAGAAFALGAEIARALDYAHRDRDGQSGVFHGRLNAGKVFVSPEGQVKVADMGVSAAFEESGQDGPSRDRADLLAVVRRALSCAPAADRSRAERALVDLEGVADAATLHERLLELAYVFGPTAADRDPGVFARETAAPAFALGDVTVTPSAPPADAVVAPEPEAPRATGRFVGRHAELRELGRAIERTLASGPGIVSIHGPPGIGKTRLLRELERRVGTARAAFVYVDAELSPQGVPFGVLGDLVRALLGSTGRARLDAAELTPLLRASGLEGPDVAALGRLFGASDAADVSTPLVGALARLLARAGGGLPLVIAIDRGERIDGATRAVLAELALTDEASHLAVLFLVAEDAQPSAPIAASRTTSLALGELDDDALAQLVASRLGARLLPPELFELVAEHAGGHPSLAEDVVRDLGDRVLVRVTGGVAEVAPEAAAELSVADVRGKSGEARCAARIVRASPEERDAIALASLVADGVCAADVAAATGQDPEEGALLLDALERDGIARSSGDGRTYFARPYVEAAASRWDADRKATVAGRLAEGRRSLATRAMEEGADPNRIAACWLSAARCFEVAGRSLDAATASCEAAAALEAAGSTSAAAELFAAALPRVEHAHLACRCVHALARLAGTADLPAADLAEGLAQALGVADPSLSPEDRVSVRLKIARGFAVGGFEEIADVLVDQAQALATDPLDAQVLEVRLCVAALTADPLRARDALEAFDRATVRGDAFGTEALLDAASAALAQGVPRRAATILDRISAEQAPADARARIHLLRGRLAARLDQPHEASREYQEALAIGRAGVAPRAASLAAIELAEKEPSPRAFALLREAVNLARRANDASVLELASAHLDWLERGVRARRDLEQKVQRARARGRLHDAELLAKIGESSPRD